MNHIAKSACCGCVPAQEDLKCAFMWAGTGLEKLPHFPLIWGRWCVCPLFLLVLQKVPGFGKRPGATGGPSAALPLPTEGWGELLFLSVWFVSMGLMRAPAFLPDLLRIK